MHSEDISELLKALMAAEDEFESIQMTKTGQAGSFKFHYADLKECFRATKPALKKHGLKCNGCFANQEGRLTLSLILSHAASGQWMKSTMPITPASNSPTDLGKFITYMRRYMYVTLLGVVSDEDVEGDALDAVDAKKSDNRLISKDQCDELTNLILDSGRTVQEVLDKHKIKSLDSISEKTYKSWVQYLSKGN
ncbi:MAG: ERF family protein [Pseudomonadota bacterium]|nr:ERF family protein [Pseudomonadota bacterium]